MSHTPWMGAFVVLFACGSGAVEGPAASPPATGEPSGVSTPNANDDAGTSVGADGAVAAPNDATAPADAAPGDDRDLPACPAAPATFHQLLDVAYANDHPVQKLDLYVPDGAGKFPLIVWIHGGGWKSGDKSPTMAKTQALRGYVVASVNYRLSDVAKFPAQLHDVKAAVRFLRANAATYSIEPNRVAAWGSSAGGHLAALMGTSGGVAAMEGAALGNAAASSRVQAVVDFFGPTDFSKRQVNIPAACGGTLENPDDETSSMSMLLGCPIQSCPAAVAAANPITYVDANDPPFLIEHGDSDCTVVPNQSEILFDALESAGVPASLEIIPGAGHGGPEFRDAQRKARVNGFLDARLKGCR